MCLRIQKGIVFLRCDESALFHISRTQMEYWHTFDIVGQFHIDAIRHDLGRISECSASEIKCAAFVRSHKTPKGVKVSEVFQREPSYYDWMMNGDFPLYTKKVITEIRLREKKF